MSPTPPEEDALKRAFMEGERRAHVDGMLKKHDEAIQALSEGQTKLLQASEEQGEKIDAITAEMQTQRALKQQELEQLKLANNQSLSTRNYILGIAAVVVSLTGVIVAVLTGAHVI